MTRAGTADRISPSAAAAAGPFLRPEEISEKGIVNMSIPFIESETRENLMRAFAGESQARNRYTIAASQARKSGLAVIEGVFTFTANQEKEHAEVFYKHLTECAGSNISIDGSYPVDLSQDVAKLLRCAQHNEFEEHDDVYRAFEEKAREEGFSQIAASFHMIGAVEKVHGDRFGLFADLLEQERLFVSDVQTSWMCLQCGNIYTGTSVPEKCPVCGHDRGYYVRLELAPYTALSLI